VTSEYSAAQQSVAVYLKLQHGSSESGAGPARPRLLRPAPMNRPAGPDLPGPEDGLPAVVAGQRRAGGRAEGRGGGKVLFRGDVTANVAAERWPRRRMAPSYRLAALLPHRAAAVAPLAAASLIHSLLKTLSAHSHTLLQSQNLTTVTFFLIAPPNLIL